MTASSIKTDLLSADFTLEISDFITRLKRTTSRPLTGESLMHELARTGDVLTAETISAFGSEVDLPDEEGRRPLHEAAFFGHADMVDFLIKAGARIDMPIAPFGHTALYDAVHQGHHGIAKTLIQCGANMYVQDRLTGFGLLHLAAARGDMEMCGLLIAAGVDVLAEDKKGMTARDHAARHRHAILENTLLKVMEHHASYHA